MKIKLSIDNYGFLTITVISKAWNKKIQKHLKRYGQPWDGTLFVQDSPEYTAKSLFYLTESEIQELQDGWDKTIIVDPWTFLQMVGWDATDLLR